MTNIASRTGIGVAVSAGVVSVAWGSLVPGGYPWPSLAWALLACAIAVWVTLRSSHPSPSMSDVINDVEGEPAPVAAVSKPGTPVTRATS